MRRFLALPFVALALQAAPVLTCPPEVGQLITGVPWGIIEPMRTSRFKDEQVHQILQEAQAGTAVKVLCAKHNISPATFHAWKRKFGGMNISEARRLRALSEENTRLKRLVADKELQIQIL